MSKYWIKRQEKREDLSFQKGSKEVKEYIKVLEKAKQGINDKIARLYAKYGQDSGLPRTEAMRVIKGDEYKEWRFKIEDYVKQLNSIQDKNSIEFKKLSLELETLAYRSRINRLVSLKADIDMELIKAGDKAVKSMTNALTSTYSDTYKTLVDDLKFKSHVDMDRVKKVLGYDWSGSNYSNRIWGNTETLAKTIKNEVLMGINQGINYKTMSTRIADKFNTAYKNAERLVRTEVNYIHNQATADSYKDAGVEKYQFIATLDHRTSETCAGLNGEVFELKNIAVGINYPPMHPRCRSTTIPIIDYVALQNIKEDDEKALINNDKNDKIKTEEEYKTRTDLRENRILSSEETVEKIKFLADEYIKVEAELLKRESNDHLREFIDMKLGINGLPTVLEDRDFRKMTFREEILFRGVQDFENSPAKLLNDAFRFGESKYGNGRFVYGRGTYTTPILEIAETYAVNGKTGKGEVMKMILKPEAKVVTYKDIMQEMDKERRKFIMQVNISNPSEYEKKTLEILQDPGTFAAIKGYDAISLDGYRNQYHYVIQDRSKLIVSKIGQAVELEK